MKNYITYLFILLPTLMLAQQRRSLKVEHFTLENGLNIYLNQDATASNVFGGILVKAGSIHESPDATGMSHYLEHMLFKGNRDLGSIDFVSENVHYQRIINLYEELEKNTGSKRKKIQNQINEESINAAKFGLPNEFSSLMKSLGSTHVSAFADYDVTFYHSYFPAQNLPHWIDINAERLINPVFRTFQSELEVVYEEKNRWDDDFENALYVASQELLYENYTYGLWPTIGKTEHLKNPSLTQMHEFFDKHYVASNMTLILSGNFDPIKAKSYIKESFSRLPSIAYEPIKFSDYKPMIGERKKEISVTPMPLIGLLFPIKTPYHKDRAALDISMYLISNDQKTGILDKLEIDNKIQKIYTEIDDHALASSYNIYAVPNDGNSFDRTKSLILDEISKLSNPTYFQTQLKAAKQNLIKGFWLDLENLESRTLLIAACDFLKVPWERALNYPSEIENVSSDKITATVNQYFFDNYGLLISKKGKPKKDKIEKPSIKPITALQSVSSNYGRKLLSKLSNKVSDPLIIDFNVADTFNIGSHKGILVRNAINDLFSLEIRFQIGWRTDPKLHEIADLLTYVGTSRNTNEKVKSTFESLGCRFETTIEAEEMIITLNGIETNLQACLKLVNELLVEPKVTSSSLESLYNSEKIRREEEKSSSFLLGYALIRFGVFDNQTKFLTRTPIETIKQTETKVYEKRITQLLLNNKVHINYFGSKSKNEIRTLIQQELHLSPAPIHRPVKSVDVRDISKNKVFIINSDKSRQNQVYFYLKGSDFETTQYPYVEAFNTYFGESLTGVVYQEIREYRSLAYSIFGRYISPAYPSEPGYLVTGFGCQSDKTDETIEVMVNLLKEFPTRPGRIESLKSTKIEEITTDYPTPRQLGGKILELQRSGYVEDPNKNAFNVYKKLQMADLAEFYNSQFKGQPFVMTIYGNTSDVSIKKLESIGQVVELKPSDILID